MWALRMSAVGEPQSRQFNGLIAQFQALLEAEYKRGAAEALENIAKVLGNRLPASFGSVEKRVPKGVAKKFVAKTLADTPMSIAEIRAAAKTDLERRLSYQTIRLELERGRKDKRFKKSSGGKWTVNS